jgi:hypothetical protein
VTRIVDFVAAAVADDTMDVAGWICVNDNEDAVSRSVRAVAETRQRSDESSGVPVCNRLLYPVLSVKATSDASAKL